jgi:hypothetical protein
MKRISLPILVALMFLPSVTKADDAPPFPKGLWTLDLTGSYANHIRYSEDKLAGGTVGVNYYVLDNFSLGLHATGYAVDQPVDNGYGVGAEGWLRIHLLNIDRFTLYFDGGGGRGYFHPEEPAGGTNWNWTAKAGLGVGYRISDDAWLIGGARYFHISNGDQFGRENNPSFDAIQYYAGLMIRM